MYGPELDFAWAAPLRAERTAAGLPAISAVVHTLDEEEALPGCLASLAWVDEVVVLDMGSTDRTTGIATAAGARVVVIEPMGIVEPARNLGISLAAHDWILLVDADERVPEGLARHLAQTCARTAAGALSIPFRHWICGAYLNGTGWGVTRHLRFFRRGEIVWPKGVHAVPDVRCEVENVPGGDEMCMVHLNYRDFSHFLRKLDRYTSHEPAHLDDAGAPLTWARAVADAQAEVTARWQPERDGTRSAALSFAMLAYRLFAHVKRWEREGWPVLEDLPADADAALGSLTRAATLRAAAMEASDGQAVLLLRAAAAAADAHGLLGELAASLAAAGDDEGAARLRAAREVLDSA